jgi:hypothetical protein
MVRLHHPPTGSPTWTDGNGFFHPRLTCRQPGRVGCAIAAPLGETVDRQQPRAEPVEVRHQSVDHDRDCDRCEYEGAEHR